MDAKRPTADFIEFIDEKSGKSFVAERMAVSALDNSSRYKTAPLNSVRALKQEAELVRGLRHNNIEAYAKVSRSESLMIIKWERGGPVDLYDIMTKSHETTKNQGITNRGPSVDVFFAIARQIVLAMLYLFSKGIYHGNISPQAIVIGKNYFNVSSIDVDVQIKLSGTSFSYATKSKTRKESIGSIAYQSPESLLVDLRPIDYSNDKHDVWCLGTSMYHFATGRLLTNPRLPFSGNRIFFIDDVHSGQVSGDEMELRYRRAIDSALGLRRGVFGESNSARKFLRSTVCYDPMLRANIFTLCKIGRLDIPSEDIDRAILRTQ
jgi:serine/threonine protein kinase